MLRPLRLVIGRLSLLEIDGIVPDPLAFALVPPDEALALGPGAPRRVGGSAVVHGAAVGRPGETPAEMRSRPAGSVRLARAGAVLARLRNDAAVEPGAAGRRAVVFQRLEARDLLAVGDGVAVHLHQHALGIGLAALISDRIVPGQGLEPCILGLAAARIKLLQATAELEDEPGFRPAVAGRVDHLVMPLDEPVGVRED